MNPTGIGDTPLDRERWIGRAAGIILVTLTAIPCILLVAATLRLARTIAG
jgi:hypothetical protein